MAFVHTRPVGPREPLAESARIPLARPHLAALDGLRFIAAFCVLAGHGYWYVVQLQTESASDLVGLAMRSLPGLGMTLFFVLSGFVIHFNYHESVGRQPGGRFEFFAARFSRLYPLFIAVFAFDFFRLLHLQGYFSGHPNHGFDLFRPLPFFLTFTQTWLFIPIQGHPLYDHYGMVTSHIGSTVAMWSLSTEWMFYAAYPFLSIRLARLRGWPLAAFAGLIAAFGLLYYTWCAYHVEALRLFGLRHFHSPELAGSFIGWMVFYSPFGRITEFLLGAAAAQYYLSSPPSKGFSSRWASIAATLLAVAIVGWIVGSTIFATPVSGVNASCVATAVALIVVVAARYKTWLTRVLGSPLLVKCGEASYSLYLLHYTTMHEWAVPYAVGASTFRRVLVFLIGMLASIAISRVVFLVYERPALRWLRRQFGRLRWPARGAANLVEVPAAAKASDNARALR